MQNGIIEASPQNPQQGSVKSTYIYDYMGRRAKKTLYTYSSGSWQKQKDISFIYDGWNMVKESEKASDSSPEVPVYYVWNLDLSQSMQGAGGVGGLIASVKSGNEYLYSYDGNGNVGQMVKSSDGSIAARYEYDPFGKTIFSEGPMASENPYRFSTKYLDDETDLYYYGYRYYDVEMGRWINRDPIGEMGGMNLFVSFMNGPVLRFDTNGLYNFDMHYLATYMALKAAGLGKSDALKIAYGAALPDADKSYDAIVNAFSYFLQSSKDYSQMLHMLKGMKENELIKFRQCLKCLIDDTKDLFEKGVYLHVLADTYGHKKIKATKYKSVGGPAYVPGMDINEFKKYPSGGHIAVAFETEDETYSGLFGHFFDGTWPDQISKRPELAKTYLNEVFSLFGGKDPGLMSRLLGKIDEIANSGLDNGKSYEELKKMMMANPKAYDYDLWTPEEKKYDPGGNTFFFQDQLFDGKTIGEDRMQTLISKLIENLGKDCTKRK